MEIDPSEGETVTVSSGCSVLIKGLRRAATLTLVAMNATRVELGFELATRRVT